MKVLAVDDDTFIRELLPMILAESGITDVTVAISARNALSVIDSQKEPFDCFLLDIQMPGGSGIDLCRAIRKLPCYQKTPIIMLTAMHEKSFIDDAFAAGATDYATKPFEIAEVSARLRTAKLLVDEQRKSLEIPSGTSETGGNPISEVDPDFASRLDLGALRGVVTTLAFENYLNQLSRAGLQSSTFFAIHVQASKTMFDQRTLSEVQYALRHVADAIIASQLSSVILTCYVGSGNFICCSSATMQPTPERIEQDIQGILDDKDLTFDDGSPLDTEVAIGATVQLPITGSSRFEALESQAIKRAMVRAEEKCAEPQRVNIKRVNR